MSGNYDDLKVVGSSPTQQDVSPLSVVIRVETKINKLYTVMYKFAFGICVKSL